MSGQRTLDDLTREQWLRILDLAKGGDVWFFPTIDEARAESARRLAPLFEGEKHK